MPSTDDPLHRSLIADVDAHLRAAGFCVSSQETYHEGRLAPAAKNRLSVTFSPTALHIRGAADNIAVHPGDGMALRYEGKTSATAPDLCVEALPLADHMLHARRGVLCLYCAINRGAHRGFWAHDVPRIRQLLVPPQRTEALAAWYDDVLPGMFPRVDILHINRTVGSNDPFVVIDAEDVDRMPDWRELFDDERRSWTRFGAQASLWTVAGLAGRTGGAPVDSRRRVGQR